MHTLSLLLSGCSMLDLHALQWTPVSPDEFFAAGVGVHRASNCGILRTRRVRAQAARALSQYGASHCTPQFARCHALASNSN